MYFIQFLVLNKLFDYLHHFHADLGGGGGGGGGGGRVLKSIVMTIVPKEVRPFHKY